MMLIWEEKIEETNNLNDDLALIKPTMMCIGQRNINILAVSKCYQ